MIPFNDFVKAYGKGATLLFASAAVSYFLTYYTTLTPPTKPRQAIYGMSVLVEAYGVLLGLTSRRFKTPPLTLMILSVALYLISLYSLTFLVPTADCVEARLPLLGANSSTGRDPGKST